MVSSQKAVLACCSAAFISFIFSITLWFTGHREEGIFVGLWVPSILSSGTLLIPFLGKKNE
jgi:hypothetical protein